MRSQPLTFGILILLAGIAILVFFRWQSFLQTPEEYIRQNNAQRQEDIEALHHEVDNFYRTHGRLPASVFEMSPNQEFRDPKTTKRYEYETSEPNEYVICATFETLTPPAPRTSGGIYNCQWFQIRSDGTSIRLPNRFNPLKP